MAKQSVGDRVLQGKGRPIDFKKIAAPKDNEEILDGESFFLDLEDREVQDCLANLPPLQEMHNPLTINNIMNHQAKDVALRQMTMKDPIIISMRQCSKGKSMSSLRIQVGEKPGRL